MDEVWDDGKELLVVNGGHVEHVLLSGIMNVNYSEYSNPRIATVQLRDASRWSENLKFIPARAPRHFFDLVDNKTIDDLVRRIDAARQKT